MDFAVTVASKIKIHAIEELGWVDDVCGVRTVSFVGCAIAGGHKNALSLKLGPHIVPAQSVIFGWKRFMHHSWPWNEYDVFRT